MRRFIEDHLNKWKESRRRKPLILRGARQIGKTYSLRQFGKSFESMAVIDLERHPEWHGIFAGNLSARRICADLEVVLHQKIVSGRTLLFFDEIQSCPKAITALRYFFEEMPALHVVAAGSLLEFAMRDISMPVGRIQFMQMYPMSFAEYLHGIGNDEAAARILSSPGKVSPTIHDYLCGELRRYFMVGGMPESVKAYAETGSLRESFEVQAEICETYRMDFAKYTPHADKHCLNAVMASIARNVGQQIKYSRLAEGYSNPTLKKAFELLCLANVIRRVPSANPSGLPLGSTASSKFFKALMVDIGFMRHLSGMPADTEYDKTNLLDMFRGALAEQFVGQEMLQAQSDAIYYWSRCAKSSSAEVDYLAVINGRIHPIEVKSGPAGRLKSLHLFLKTYPNSGRGIVLSDQPYAELPEQNIVFMPIYFACSITK